MRLQALTEEFYRWELRGRGWDVWPYPVALEPPFRPFRFHGATIGPSHGDDGRLETPGSRLANRIRAFLRPQPARDGAPGSALEGEELPEPAESVDWVEIGIRLPGQLDVTLERSARMLTSLGSSPSGAAFEIVGSEDSVDVGFACGAAERDHLTGILQAYFPEVIAGESRDRSAAWEAATGDALVIEYGLSDEFMLPLADGKTCDPQLAIFAALDRLRAQESAAFQVMFTPVAAPWAESILRAVSDGTGRSFFADAPHFLDLSREKTRAPLFAATVRVGVRADGERRRWELARSVASGLKQLERPGSNALIPLDPGELHSSQLEAALLNRTTYRSGMLLSAAELASLVHLPDASVVSERLERRSRRTKAVAAQHSSGELVLGTNYHRGVERPVALSADERSRHIYIVGASGTGKSTLLLSLIQQDLEAGRGFAVLDPHGDLADEVAARVPDHRVQEVVLFDPSDTEAPVSFNVLEARTELERQLLESDFAAIFRRMATSWGDQMTAVLANGVGAILSHPEGGSLIELRRFLSDRAFREAFLEGMVEPEIVHFWRREFPLLSGRPEASVLTRLNALLRPGPLRRVLGVRTGTLDVGSLVESGGILLARLPAGLVGEENAYLLGSLLVSKIHHVVMARQATSAPLRVPFALYVDEFQHFATPSMASILEGARKYGLGLILAHQTLRQLGSGEIVASALANAHTRVCFRLGPEDSRKLAEGFSAFSPLDLEDLGTGQAIARIGAGRQDFNLDTHLPPPAVHGRRNAVREASQRTWGSVTPTDSALATPQQPLRSGVEASGTSEVPADASTQGIPTGHVAPPLSGRGGSEHKYLQHLVKRLGEDRGWRATVEAVLPAGGRADVALVRGEYRVAFEISVSTDAGHELVNVVKCIEAGFHRVALVLPSPHARKRFREALSQHQISDEHVAILGAPGIPSFLESLDSQQAGDCDPVVRGYRVKLAQGSQPSDAGRAAIARVVAESVSRSRKRRPGP